jgi:hypothetical protein
MAKTVVYQITNTVNDKIYIGVHKLCYDESRCTYMGSGTRLRSAIRKYGLPVFRKQVLYECATEEEAYMLERRIVNFDFITRNDTYNIKVGGKQI